MTRLVISILTIALIIVWSGCDEPERTVLTSEEKILLDSIYSDIVPQVRKEADSLCEAMYQTMFDEIADSIKQVYIQEIREIIEGEG